MLQRPPVKTYEYGTLVELYRPEWSGVFEKADGLGHLYFINNPQEGGRGEWHKHELTLDRYSVVRGVVEIVLWDTREGSASKDTEISVTLEAGSLERYSMLRIPPGIWHTILWKSGDGGILVNAKDPAFIHADPDKYRLPFATKSPQPVDHF